MDQKRMDALVRAYVNLREARAQNTRESDARDKELSEKQDAIGNALLGFLNESGLNSARAESGTFYKQEDLTPTGADWAAFYDWIKRNDAFEALERRIKKTFIRTYMEANKGAIPPGVSVFRQYKIHVNKA